MKGDGITPRELPWQRHGFRETIVWKPGFDDPDVPRAGGTEGIVLDAEVTYVPPSSLPAEIFLTLKPPHHGGNGPLALQAEDTGKFLSLLLRLGIKPSQLIETTSAGGMGRAAALFLQRCPLVTWVTDTTGVLHGHEK
jgi:hypothetical protein